MLPGQNYFFMIKIVKGGFCKVGVCRRKAPVEMAFCDTEDGWALYNGELRHNSNCAGKPSCTLTFSDFILETSSAQCIDTPARVFSQFNCTLDPD